MNSNELVTLFFNELRDFNSTNFKILRTLDVTLENSKVYKSCSSVITRYFIFREHHPEIPEASMKLLYFKLRLDLIARYFSEYPAANIEDLKPFQRELQLYMEADEKKSAEAV